MNLIKKMALVSTMTAVSLTAVPVFASTVLTFGEPGPNRGQRAADTQWFADQVELRSGGDLKINIQWGGALFKAKAARQSVATGVADMGTIIQGYFPRELVSYSIGDMPFVNQDAWVGTRALNEHMQDPAIKAQLAAQNLAYVAPHSAGKVVVVCKGDPIRTLDDIKNKNIRGISAYGKGFGDLGANLVNMSIYKAYQGLDTGLIDCTQSYLAPSAALKHYEVSSNVTKVNWGLFAGLGMFINTNSYERLSATQKQVLDEVAADYVDYISKSALEGEITGEKSLKDAGLKFYTLSAEDTEKLSKVGEPYIVEWAKRATQSGLDGDAMVSRYRGLLDKYTQELNEKGYPWAR
ncbi:C4-dicarboxylate TRAP transporter substrate-binding protein [uncultured Amphritea sp.]|uniref:C4-dicarboxylate TRAP transporter substrate-binding protein n=1 Tax=uncultured Amphritea sp. TaxID=981605 RepID=UPI002636DA0A|nr:C4-dicarboxylate TRAP transporter substrate-binding protein [uncultured Amphritea sp.]